MTLTLILVPGGVRALIHDSLGWEAWWFSRILIVPMILCHVILCWLPLAARYFRKGHCHDVAAFLIASASLFVQSVICYALFSDYSLWHG